MKTRTAILMLAACSIGLVACQADESSSGGESSAQARTAEKPAPESPTKATEPAARMVMHEQPEEPIIYPVADPVDQTTGFATNAFPPTITDKEWHEKAWMEDNCLDCHETGVSEAPQIRHEGLVALAMQSKCRTCHVIEPGKLEAVTKEDHGPFVEYAFPPMLPNNKNHLDVWNTRDCLMCHEQEVDGAPKVTHEGMVSLLLESACRTCHVQVRAHETIPPRD